MFGVEVLGRRQRRAAHTTEDRRFVESVPGPGFRVVIDSFLVAAKTRVVRLTATKPEGDDVSIGVVVGTPSIRVDVDAVDFHAVDELHARNEMG